MVNTHTSFKSYKYTQTTDGTNDYYVGINGTNGFVITPFQAQDEISLNILINFPNVIDSTDAQARLLEIANSARTSLLLIDVGAYTGTLTGEYIGLATAIAGVVKTVGANAGGASITAGWHLITIARAAPLSVYISVDGILRVTTNGSGGAPTGATDLFTANQVSLMATTTGGVPFGCTWREAAIINTPWSEVNALQVYNFYTRSGNVSLEKSDRSIWRYLTSPAGRAQLIALYKGNESGTDLLCSVNSASDLTKTNF